MKNGILCTIDFSEESQKALQWSVQLAKNLKSHLTILYTYRLLKSNGEAVSFKKSMEVEAAKNFALLEKKFLEGQGVSYDFKTEVGFLADRVMEHSNKNGVNIIVTARNTNSMNKESFEEMVRTTQIPLILVP